MSLLEVNDLKKYYPLKKQVLSRTREYVYAVDGVSFSLESGETLGLVGESGCGKSTLGFSILRLIEPTSGRIHFNNKDIMVLNREQLRHERALLQAIFQDPYSSLNPRLSVKQIIAEPIKNHLKLSKRDIYDKVAELMKKVGLHPDQMERYPHEFSGGQRQRIGIARALALNPLAIVCDEPVSALDVSVQAQVINLMSKLQDELNISYLFIAHDLSVVEHISHRVAVMYLGRIVEIAPDTDLYQQPLHPYTQALLSAIPRADPENKKEKILLEGDVPSPHNPPPGCNFNTRCRRKMKRCSEDRPVFKELAKNHWVACHLYD